MCLLRLPIPGQEPINKFTLFLSITIGWKFRVANQNCLKINVSVYTNFFMTFGLFKETFLSEIWSHLAVLMWKFPISIARALASFLYLHLECRRSRKDRNDWTLKAERFSLFEREGEGEKCHKIKNWELGKDHSRKCTRPLSCNFGLENLLLSRFLSSAKRSMWFSSWILKLVEVIIPTYSGDSFFIGTATQLVILQPLIPWKGQWWCTLLLQFSLICVSGLTIPFLISQRWSLAELLSREQHWSSIWRELWPSGYGRRLMIKSPWAQFLPSPGADPINKFGV